MSEFLKEEDKSIYHDHTFEGGFGDFMNWVGIIIIPVSLILFCYAIYVLITS